MKLNAGIPAISFEPYELREYKRPILQSFPVCESKFYLLNKKMLFFFSCSSKQAVFDGKRAIRGGIPFVFRK